MNEKQKAFIEAERCLIEVLESYMEFVERVFNDPGNAMVYAEIARCNWQPVLDDVKAKHESLLQRVKDKK